ncbi:protein C3orf33 homolog isoform X2 [Phyllopteryx taeniolatus]|uniref:protein C3orf33 homolog isoform X2 n=1 Tax=Phyllopteryx taeniolatus TaxID=161469 RepID=UPI002AD5AC52|nr:protein C3orf33 homolog isoform X2 [Phyllopteryx taeniolatus]
MAQPVIRIRGPLLFHTTPESSMNRTCIFLQSGRKPEYPKKTDASTGRTSKYLMLYAQPFAYCFCDAVTVIIHLLSPTQSISGGLALAGVIVIARSIKLITKFQTVSEIPARFVESNVSLRGRVHSVTDQALQVEHVPIYLPLLSPRLAKHKGVPTSPLLVKLAGVDLTAEGKLWLQRRVLPAQTVWLKLISRQDDALHCFVAHSMGSSWGRSVNEEALYLGLARRAPVAGLSQHSRLYWRLHQRLHRAEVKAEKRRLGLWREDSQWERAVKAVRDSALFRLLCRLFGRT